MKNFFILSLLFLAILFVLISSQSVNALECQTNSPTFTAIKSGNWNDPALWDKGIIPSSNHKKVIPNDLTVTISSYVTNSCTITNSGTLSIMETIENTGTIDNFNFIAIQRGTINNHGAINNHNAIRIIGENSMLNNFGSINIKINSYINIEGSVVRNGGTITLEQSNAVVVIDNGLLENAGIITVGGGATLAVNQGGGTIQNSKRIENSGSIHIAKGTLSNTCTAKITNSGRVTGIPINEIPCAPNLLLSFDEVDNPRPELVWQNPAETRPVKYSVTLQMVDSDQNIELESTGIFSAKPKNDLQNGEYDWLVSVTIDPSYNPGYSFTSQKSDEGGSFSIISRLNATDPDGDGISSSNDNCPNVSNRDQTDSDRDGIGDACDPTPLPQTSTERDTDGIPDNHDNCPNVSNRDQTDSDRDGIGDACDPTPLPQTSTDPDKEPTIPDDLIKNMKKHRISLSDYSEPVQILISGALEDYSRGTPVHITIQKPDGNIQDITIYAKKTGEYSTTLFIDDTWDSDEYIVITKYNSKIVDSFLIDLVDQQIPPWIKTNAGKWASGKISNNTFLQSLQYLIENEIITVPSYGKILSSDSHIPSWMTKVSGWWAGGKIDDSTFINIIQYLVQNQIIRAYDTTQSDVVQQGITESPTSGEPIQTNQNEIFLVIGSTVVIIGIVIVVSLLSLKKNKK